MLQTSEYGSAVTLACILDERANVVDQRVGQDGAPSSAYLRPRPEPWTIIDEAVLRREIGGPCCAGRCSG
jgi:hypothetical protein